MHGIILFCHFSCCIQKQICIYVRGLLLVMYRPKFLLANTAAGDVTQLVATVHAADTTTAVLAAVLVPVMAVRGMLVRPQCPLQHGLRVHAACMCQTVEEQR